MCQALLALAIGAIEALGTLADQLPQLVDQPVWGGAWRVAQLLHEHMDLVGLAAVAAFLTGIGVTVLLARACIPSQKECEEQEADRRRASLQDYLRQGNYIVRFE